MKYSNKIRYIIEKHSGKELIIKKVIRLIIPVFLFISPLFSDNSTVIMRIIQSAQKQINTPGSTFARGKRFNRDCSGFTSMIFYLNGIDLLKTPRRMAHGRNMVASLYNAAASRGDIIHRNLPQPGDMVFFDRTYDANRNGRRDDPLTHVGIVEKVDAETGNVYYIHRVNPGIGVKRYVMNLRYPSKMYIRTQGKRIKVNDYITRGGMSGAHFRAYIRLKDFSNSDIATGEQNNASSTANSPVLSHSPEAAEVITPETQSSIIAPQTQQIVEPIKIEKYPNGKIFRKYPFVNGKVTGTFLEYFPNGNIRIQAEYLNNKKHGIHIYYYEDGKMFSKTHYLNDIKNGFETFYYPNGKLRLFSVYKNGKPHGKWFWYDRNERIVSQAEYQNGVKLR